MARRVSARLIASLFGVLVLGLGYLLYGQQIAQSPNPLETAVAAVISPTLVLAALALVLAFLIAIVALAIRSGRSVRLGRGGVSIGGARR